jgi:hypothetical protein
VSHKKVHVRQELKVIRLSRWWKAKIKPGEDGADVDKVGLVPSNYVEEV